MLNLDKSGWETVRFGDVVRNVNETVRNAAEAGIEKVIALEHLDPGEVTIQRFGDTAESTTFTRRVRPGQTLFGKRRAYQRKAAYSEVEAICSGDILVFEAVPERLSARLLPFLVHSEPFFAHALGTSAGSLSPRTNWKSLAAFDFSLPPLEEQERIADLLWAVETCRKAERAVEHASRAVFDAVLDVWWATTPLRPVGSLGKCITGTTPSKAEGSYWDREEVPFLTPSEIRETVVSPPRQWLSNIGASRAKLVSPGAVLVACIGGDMGRAAVLDAPATTNQQITAVTQLDNQDAFVLQAILMHRRGRAATAAYETTTVVRKLNKSDLEKVEVPWSASRHERAVVIRYREFEKMTKERDSRLAVVCRMLLREVFGGAS